MFKIGDKITMKRDMYYYKKDKTYIIDDNLYMYVNICQKNDIFDYTFKIPPTEKDIRKMKLKKLNNNNIFKKIISYLKTIIK